MTLGQEMRWAYSTMLTSPHGVNRQSSKSCRASAAGENHIGNRHASTLKHPAQQIVIIGHYRDDLPGQSID